MATWEPGRIRLLQYFETHIPPTIPLAPVTRKLDLALFHWLHIEEVPVWETFNYAEMMRRYRALINLTFMDPDPMPESPTTPIIGNEGVRAHFFEYIAPRVRRALRATFCVWIRDTSRITAITWGDGSSARHRTDTVADVAFVEATDRGPDQPNRLPGVLKISWMWNSAWRSARAGTPEYRDYRAGLAEVLYHMNEPRTRYGFILTDRELVAVRRSEDEECFVEVAEPVEWHASGPGQLTLMMAAWWLGLLAADNQTWHM